MAEFKRSVITLKGRELLARAQAGAEIHFTRMEVGDGLPVGDPTDMTGLVHMVRSYGIEGYHADGTDFAAWTTIGSDGNATGYFLREQGLFAANPDAPNDRAQDILYAVSVIAPMSADHDYFAYIPAAGGASVVGWRLEMHTVVAGAANVEVIVGAPTDYATQADLEAYTPLATFKPEKIGTQTYGRHPHKMEDIDGLPEEFDEIRRLIDLLASKINNNVEKGKDFTVTFWSMDGKTLTDGQWVPETGHIIA